MKENRIYTFCSAIILLLGIISILSILKSKQSLKSLKQTNDIIAYLDELNINILESTSQHYIIDNLFDLSMFEDREFIVYYRFFKTSCFSCVMNSLNVLISQLNEYKNQIIIGGAGENFEITQEYLDTNGLKPICYNMGNHRLFPIDQLGIPYFCLLYKIENKVFILNLWVDINDSKLLDIIDQCKILLCH